MPRKPNYNFEKRRREEAREAKKNAKLEEKMRRKQEAQQGELPPEDANQLPPSEGQ